jgi:hypothetical protein
LLDQENHRKYLICIEISTHHASTTEDDESKRNKKIPFNEKENRKEYYLVLALSTSVSLGTKTWLA